MEIPRRASGVKRPTTPDVSPGTPPSAAAVPSVASPHGHRRRPTTPDELSDKPPATPPSPVRNTCPSPAQRANSYGTPWLLGYRQLLPGRSQRRDGSDQTMTETASGKGSRPSPGALETTVASLIACQSTPSLHATIARPVRSSGASAVAHILCAAKK